MRMLTGALLVSLSGLAVGSCVWPMKLLRHYRFEHCWFVAMLLALVVLPWTGTLLLCPDVLTALGEVEPSHLVRANLLSVSWGIANVLFGLCVVRIGVSLANAILSGVAAIVGVSLPMIWKAPGLFSRAPDITSTAGLTVLFGVAVMLAGVILAARAGFARQHALQRTSSPRDQLSGGFLGGLLMSLVAGVLSIGLSMSFVYSQDAITAAIRAHGGGDFGANLAVWAVGVQGGALVNLLYPSILIYRSRSWGVLWAHRGEMALSALMGLQFFVAIMCLLGRGMVLFGVLGASVGFGIQQAMQLVGGQGLGFVSGEWRQVRGSPRMLICAAIACLLMASLILAYASGLDPGRFEAKRLPAAEEPVHTVRLDSGTRPIWPGTISIACGSSEYVKCRVQTPLMLYSLRGPESGLPTPTIGYRSSVPWKVCQEFHPCSRSKAYVARQRYLALD